MEKKYHWHKHDNDDEFPWFWKAPSTPTFAIGWWWNTVELRPWQGFTVPRGVEHRRRTPRKCVIIMVETAHIVPTGD